MDCTHNMIFQTSKLNPDINMTFCACSLEKYLLEFKDMNDRFSEALMNANITRQNVRRSVADLMNNHFPAPIPR